MTCEDQQFSIDSEEAPTTIPEPDILVSEKGVHEGWKVGGKGGFMRAGKWSKSGGRREVYASEKVVEK